MSTEKINNKVFIQALEQRILLDGSASTSILDTFEQSNIYEINKQKNNKEQNIEETVQAQDPTVSPLENQRSQSDKKNIVFIDSQVTDYEKIISAFKEGTEVYLIDANDDGFKKMAEILQDQKDIDAIHVIGH